jgi:hypothetical protein
VVILAVKMMGILSAVDGLNIGYIVITLKWTSLALSVLTLQLILSLLRQQVEMIAIPEAK